MNARGSTSEICQTMPRSFQYLSVNVNLSEKLSCVILRGRLGKAKRGPSLAFGLLVWSLGKASPD
jgi:hypothetical protein